MIDDFNPAKHSLATRFRPPLPEILIGTPINRNRHKPSSFNHLIFSTRYKKPPSPPVTILQHFIRIFFSGESTDPTRVGVPKRSSARDLLLGRCHPARMALPKRGPALHRRVQEETEGKQGSGRDPLSLEPPTPAVAVPSFFPCLPVSVPPCLQASTRRTRTRAGKSGSTKCANAPQPNPT